MPKIAIAALFAIALAGAADAATVPVVVQGTPQTAPDRLVVMTGTGIVKAMPDTAVISGGVISRARRAADAVRTNNEAMAKAVTALKAMGLTDKEISTSSFSFEPQFVTDSKGRIDPDRKIEAYIVTNRIVITLTDKLERAGEALDALLQNGANDSANVSFELRDIAVEEMKARALAGKDALTRAQTYCQEIGAQLGPVRSVREGMQSFVMSSNSIAAEDIGSFPDKGTAEALQRVPGVSLEASMRIAPQEQTITKTVTIVWTLK